MKALCRASACNTTAWESASTEALVNIAGSDASISPSVSISAPAVIGDCDDLVLDLTSSSGNGGRPWFDIAITVEALGTVNVSTLQRFLSNNYEESPPTPIPAKFLLKDVVYTFIVKLCNFMGKCSQASRRVLVQSKTIPTVTLPGSALSRLGRMRMYWAVGVKRPSRRD